jgi:hypothetical protein
MNSAVKELEQKLIKEKDTTYEGIDSLMRIIMRKYDLTAKELHNAFVHKHHKTPDEWIKQNLKIQRDIKMKTFKEFCEDANLQELFGFNFLPPPKPPQDTKVLAYRNYKSGVLDTATNKFTPRAFTPSEQQRYGWNPPVKATSYSPGDRFTPNKVTATGEPHNWTTMNAASPFRYPEGKFPKGSRQEAQPSIPYGSRLQLTAAPMGTGRGATRITTSKLNDVGDFGPTGHKNSDVSFDLSPNTVRGITGDRKTPDSQISAKWGKDMVYTKILPPLPKINPKK